MKDPSPVTVQVMQQEQTQAGEQKPPQEREEKAPTWFWDMLAEIPLEDWKAGLYQVWVLREADSRVPMAAGEKGYLDTFIEPITWQTIEQKYGGGKYKAVLNYRGRAKTSHNFEIVGVPKYDPRRERPGNSSAAQAAAASGTDAANLATQFISILREEMNHLREANQAPNGANEATVQMMANASEKAIGIMEKRIPEAGNPATMLKDLVATAKEMGVFNTERQGSTLGALVQELTPLLGLVTPLIEKFFKPADPMQQISTFMTIFEKLDGLRGSGGGGGKTDTNTLILEGIKTLPSVIEQMSANRPASGQRILPQRQIPAGATNPTPVLAANSPQHTPPAAAPSRIPSAAASPIATGPLRTTPLNGGEPASRENVGAPTNAEEVVLTPAQYDAWVSKTVVEMIFIGFDGEQIVEWLYTAKPDVVRDIHTFTEEQIEYTFGLDPMLSRALQHRNWKRVLAQSKRAAAEIVAEEAETAEEESPQPVKVN